MNTNIRELDSHKVNGCNNELTIKVLDQPGSGGANHHYRISGYTRHSLSGAKNPNLDTFTDINFQNGPIKESGVNGITQEVLLAIVADRLRAFQAGPFSSKDNAVALTHVESAILWLQKRTNERLRRGVEGTHQK